MNQTDHLAQAKREIAAGRPLAAIQILDQLHVDSHAEAGLHIRTHLVLALAHRQAGNYRRAAFELLATPFAGPASLLHKHFGIARKHL